MSEKSIPNIEVNEWLESLQSVANEYGEAEAGKLLDHLANKSTHSNLITAQNPAPAILAGDNKPSALNNINSDYVNTITPDQEVPYPGDRKVEQKIRSYLRWNAMAMVTRANKKYDGIGGHLSSYASAATLYEVAFNHFFKGKDHPDTNGIGDSVYFQGHISPGIYARAYMEGRLNEEQLDHFRREVTGKGLPSYPHPRRMPEFWEFPTVSMGIGPINSIYHARFNRYLENLGLKDTSNSHIWCFCGDGEMDEPESTAALTLAAREGLDNLTYIINCNLQRLDGPVRGNGKIIQELEALFRGSGWNVIKVVWGEMWDEIFRKDTKGELVAKLNETVDGEFQTYSAQTGAYIRENFFGEKLKHLVDHLSDEDLEHLPRGGHDTDKIFNAYRAAVNHKGAPTVILAKTVKGWALGDKIASRNATHQVKKLESKELKAFRETLHLDIPDSKLEAGYPDYFLPEKGSPELTYLFERRNALGGFLPLRKTTYEMLPNPDPSVFNEALNGTGEKLQASTTMAFARLLKLLMRDKNMGNRIVPIIPDEGRTFGMDALFSEVKIYAPFGQKYEPVDSKHLLSYKEAKDGRILEEGITEAGSLASFTAAGTAYANSGITMVPMYIFYSMFGFQRVGDLIWAFADSRGKGFLFGATAGRTTLAGEGLQHCDGQSLLTASTVPNCKSYDPAYAYELAVIIQDGINRMYCDDNVEIVGRDADSSDCFYYIALYNENYVQPKMPLIGEGEEDFLKECIIKGMYPIKAADKIEAKSDKHVRLFGSGSIILEVLKARELLSKDFGVSSDVYSVTSYQELRVDALDAENWNTLNSSQEPKVPFLNSILGDSKAPIVATTDHVKGVPEMITKFMKAPYYVLGTDGFGLSDTREAMRDYFKITAEHIAVKAIYALVQNGVLDKSQLDYAIKTYDVSR